MTRKQVGSQPAIRLVYDGTQLQRQTNDSGTEVTAEYYLAGGLGACGPAPSSKEGGTNDFDGGRAGARGPCNERKRCGRDAVSR